MRIIKQGTPPETKEIEAICRHCETVFSFRAIEAKRVNDQRDGDYWQILCPVCYKNVTKAVHS